MGQIKGERKTVSGQTEACQPGVTQADTPSSVSNDSNVPSSRWVRLRERAQVARRSDFDTHVAYFVPADDAAYDGATKADPNNSVPNWLKTISAWAWRLILLAASIWLLGHLVSRLRMLFVALFIGLVLASVLRPVRKFFDKRMKRGLAVLCTMATAVLVVGGLLAYVITSVAHGWDNVAAQFSTGMGKLIDLLNGPPLRLTIPHEHVSNAVEAGTKWLSGHSGDAAHRVIGTAGTVAEAAATIALSIFLCIFFLASGRQMWHWLLSQFPKRVQHKLSIAFGTGFVTFAGYARGVVIIALTDGIMAAILLSVLRIPLAIPLAVLVFIGAFIPMIGAPAAMLIAGIVALATEGPIKALIVIVGVALIGQIEAHLLQPFLMGHQVQLHPVIIALAVATGTVLAGIWGAVLSVPLVAVVWRIYQKLGPNAPELVPATPQAPVVN